MSKFNWQNFWRAAGALMLFASVSGQTLASEPAARMTREKVLEYYARFNAEDERYAEFLTDDVVYPYPFLGVTFHGPKEIVDHYKKFWVTGIKETREPRTIIIDNDAGLMAVELTAHIVAKPGTTPKLPTGEVVKPGEEWEGHSVMIYTLRDGKISSIRGAQSTPVKLVGKQ
jgi:hypothetical protein